MTFQRDIFDTFSARNAYCTERFSFPIRSLLIKVEFSVDTVLLNKYITDFVLLIKLQSIIGALEACTTKIGSF